MIVVTSTQAENLKLFKDSNKSCGYYYCKIVDIHDIIIKANFAVNNTMVVIVSKYQKQS